MSGEPPDDAEPSWERRAPGRFRYEIAQLEAVASDIEIDAEALKAGALRVDFTYLLNDQSFRLQAEYPDSFPRLRPSVRLLDADKRPERHCGPMDGNLCLLGRDSRQWPPRMTLAELLKERLHEAISGSASEDPQGEPAEFWWNSLGEQDSYCLVQSDWDLGDAGSGLLTIRYRCSTVGGRPRFRGYVQSVEDEAGKVIAEYHGAPPDGFDRELQARWSRKQRVVLPTGDPNVDLREIGFPEIGLREVQLCDGLFGKVAALVHSSELQHGSYQDGWVFGMLAGAKPAFYPPPKQAKKKVRPGPGAFIIPVLRSGRTDIGARVPAFCRLQEAAIGVVGLGAVGAPLAVELARNGCRKLHLVEHDTVEPGNSIRWPLGASAWGRHKLDALAEHIRSEYPWCELVLHSRQVGSVGGPPADRDELVISTVLSDVDLIVDGSASYGVKTYLFDLCQSKQVPLVTLYASAAVTGGVVAMHIPGSGCPVCIEWARHNGALRDPPGMTSEVELIQPPGCAERTFSGANYDLGELSLEAIRVVIAHLSKPETKSFLETLALVDDDGARIPPRWTITDLPVQEGCDCHAQRPSG